MSVQKELLIWVYFWCGSAFIFLMLRIFIEIYYYLKNKKK